MELKDSKLVRLCKFYIAKKDRETEVKRREEQIKGIVKALLIGKTPNQSISMLREVTEIFNERLDEELRVSLEKVESISSYKKLKRK